MLRLIILLGILPVACSNPDSAPEEPIVPASEPAPVVCLDTTLLQKDNITYQKTTDGWSIHVLRRGIPGKRITHMDWYFQRSCPNGTTHIDSLILRLADRQQIIYDSPYAAAEETHLVRPQVNFEDYNFDGDLDFRIFTSIDSLENRRYRYYLYDRSEKLFRFSELLSATVNLSVKPETGQVATFESFAPANQIFRASTFQFRKGKLTEIERTEQNYDPTINRYLVEYYESRRGTMTLIDRDTVGSGVHPIN